VADINLVVVVVVVVVYGTLVQLLNVGAKLSRWQKGQRQG
jgi:uncharacterized protein HemY